jgi:hypothetical protein
MCGASYTVRIRAIGDAYGESAVSILHPHFVANAHAFLSFGILTRSWRHKPERAKPKAIKNRKHWRKNWTHKQEEVSAPAPRISPTLMYHHYAAVSAIPV